MSKGRIAITGVAGFIGSNLADTLLKEGYDVLGIDNLAYGVREQIPDGVEFIECDIRSGNLRRSLRNVDALFHLAAKNCIPDCQTDPVETADINVTGTVNVFEAARQNGGAKVIYAESSAIYEGSTLLPTPESESAPRSFYSVSKFAGMEFAAAYQRFFGLRMTALRYFCVYGPRQDYRRSVPPLMSAFIIKLLRNERPTIYGDGKKLRDFVYVDDVNKFHMQCLRDDRTDNGVYNLGSGENESVRGVYRRIADLLNVDTEPLFAPDLPGEAQETLADISAAKALGWAPAVSLDEGLRRSIDFIKNTVLTDAQGR